MERSIKKENTFVEQAKQKFFVTP